MKWSKDALPPLMVLTMCQIGGLLFSNAGRGACAFPLFFYPPKNADLEVTVVWFPLCVRMPALWAVSAKGEHISRGMHLIRFTEISPLGAKRQLFIFFYVHRNLGR